MTMVEVRRIALAMFTAIVASLGATGCSTSAMNMQVASTANLNMNEADEPLPVVLRIYQLSQAEGFRAASFKELWRKDLQTLGNALLVKEEIVVDPAQTRRIDISRHENVKYVGVVAIFRQAEGEQWKSLTRVPDSWLGKMIGNDLQVSLKRNSVTVE